MSNVQPRTSSAALAAEQILNDFGDWQGLDLEDPRSDKFNENALRCCACWHTIPKHADRCIAWRLALEVARLRAGEQKEMTL